ncbi:hypothetical protein B0G81_1774 [Paraburkholderia sp. BL6665CI2N2]|nr:hypothetical protein B0G81_1774 [Paraburkholderia sp. BL6665CI2N2]
MLPAPPFSRKWVNKARTVRRIAAWIASEFVPRRDLAPMTHEALCYACMVGIVMPLDRDLAGACASLAKPQGSALRDERFITQRLT